MIRAYLQYLFSSKRRSSDPLFTSFYEFIVKPIPTTKMETVEAYRISLQKNHAQIKITDFGAGSRTRLSDIRTISQIAKTSGTPKKYVKILANIVDHYKVTSILELGSSLGLGTLSLDNGNCHIKSLEGDPKIYEFTSKSINQQNIEFICTEFDSYIKTDLNKYGLIFIDGNHSKEATIRYAEQLLRNTEDQTIFIFDDINWSDGMQEAWQHIISMKEFELSFDLFKFGICIKGTGQKKNFKVRY